MLYINSNRHDFLVLQYVSYTLFFCFQEDPGGYIFQLADYIEPEEKISSENLYTKLHGIFIRND